ncbi:flagellin [Hyphomonas sp.]|jgi:flagellin|uniref:flagellin N-terminal helical domain-containing protein n=1 Tax=Hyphomonas sp. TaxID=87 RepID=UPI0037BFDC3A
MSSILTNNSAMVALESLRNINRNLASVQAEISTGKKIASAKDNAAIWAISTVMTTDVESFKTIRDSLDLASSTVGVARSAAEKVTGLLQDMKSLIIAAQEASGRPKIQADITELRAQISGIVNAAQFNGQNLLKGGGAISVLSSLDRGSNQTVTAASIAINRQDLQAAVGVAGTVAITAGAGLATAGATQITTGTSSTVTLTAGAITTGTTFRVDIGGVGNRVEYISRANDTLNDVSRNLKSLIEAKGIAGISVTTTPVTDPTATNSVLNITNNSGATLSLASSSLTGGTPGGGLAGLAGINVETSDASAASALTAIEGLLTVAVNAAAALGSSQKRIENQGDFMNTLIDSITSGVGSLTDADMEAASARLQALQVQQQLGTQALSIANQGSQSLLALFR